MSSKSRVALLLAPSLSCHCALFSLERLSLAATFWVYVCLPSRKYTQEIRDPIHLEYLLSLVARTVPDRQMCLLINEVSKYKCSI